MNATKIIASLYVKSFLLPSKMVQSISTAFFLSLKSWINRRKNYESGIRNSKKFLKKPDLNLKKKLIFYYKMFGDKILLRITCRREFPRRDDGSGVQLPVLQIL